MSAGDQPPDVDDLARSMMELLGVHEHDEPHLDDDYAPTSWTKAPTFAGDPKRAAAVHEATIADRERYLSSGLAEVDCRFCHVAVRVKKLGAAHTVGAVEHRGPGAVRLLRRDPRGRRRHAPAPAAARSSSDSIKHAVAEGCLEEYSSAPAPGDG